MRILRLIEYLVTPGADATECLRRSLVGTVDLGTVRITGTIVDSCDARQEDLLTMARRQPGVWLGNSTVTERQHSRIGARPPSPEPLAKVRAQMGAGLDYYERRMQEQTYMQTPAPPPPPTGPRYSSRDRQLAEDLLQLCGPKLVHTLALSLSSIAEELAGNSEPEKFLTREECLALANALIHVLPEGWEGDPPAEDETDTPEQEPSDADR